MFFGRMALRNTPFSKCHKGLWIDPVTGTDPTVPQNERSVKGKWHLGGPSLPLTQTCDRSRSNSGAIRSTAGAACPREAHDVTGKLSDSSRSQNSSGVTMNVGRKGILKEPTAGFQVGRRVLFLTVPACPAPNTFSPALIIDLFLSFEYAWSSILAYKQVAVKLLLKFGLVW